MLPNTEQEPLGSSRPEVVQDLVDRHCATLALEQVLGKLPGYHHPYKAQWFERHRINRVAAKQATEEGGGSR